VTKNHSPKINEADHLPLREAIAKLIEKAMIYHENQALDSAKSLYNEVLILDQDNIQAHHLLGVCCYQEKNYEQALIYFNKAMTLFNKNAQENQKQFNLVELLSNFGNVYFACNDLKQAQQYYMRANELNPQHPPTLNNLGSIMFYQKNYDKASELYDMAIQYDSQFVDAYMNKANLQKTIGEYDDAILYYSKALEIDPKNSSILTGLASVYMARGDYHKAIHIIKKNPHHQDDPNSLFHLSMCFENIRDFNSQKDCLEKYLTIDNNELAWISLCNCYIELKLLDQAIKAAEKITNQDFVKKTCLATIYCKQGKFELSEKLLDEVIKKYPNLTEARLSRAELYTAINQFDKAAEEYLYIILYINPKNAEAYNNLGNIYFKTGNLVEAIEHFERALSLNPKLTIAYSNLGNALRAHRNFYGAIECCELCLKINPNFIQAYLNQALCYQALLEFNKALEVLEHAFEQFPDNEFILLQYAKILFNVSDDENAYFCFSKLIASIEHNPTGEISFTQAQAMVYFTLLKMRMGEVENIEQFKQLSSVIISEYLSDPSQELISNTYVPLLPITTEQQEALLKTNNTFIQKSCHLRVKTHEHPMLLKKKEKLTIGFVSHSYHPDNLGFDINEMISLFSKQSVIKCYQFYSQTEFQAKKAIQDYHCFEQVHIDDCANQVIQDGIDVLINLNPYHLLDVPELFALNAAPVKIGFYPQPLSLDNTFYDYQIVTETNIGHYKNPVIALPAGLKPSNTKNLEKACQQAWKNYLSGKIQNVVLGDEQ
jgi:tetratricopeptide (TPR) repeat protein